MIEKEEQKAQLTTKQKATKRCKKKQSSFVRCLKRWLYYKPKTFLGITVASAVLTTIVTAYVQKCFDFNLPFSKHFKRHDKTVCVEKDKRPHKEDNKQMVDLKKLTEFLQIWSGILSESLPSTNNMLQLNCPTCTESVKITAPVNKGVTVTCNSCQTQLFTQLMMLERSHE